MCDKLRRGRATNIGAGEDTGAGGGIEAGRDGIQRFSGSWSAEAAMAVAAACAPTKLIAVIKAWHAIQRALRALGEPASTPEGVAIERRLSRFVRLLTTSVVGFGTFPVLEGLLKASSRRTAVLKFASAREFPAESSWVATAAGKAGAILKFSVPSSGRGAEKKTRAAVSLPLTAASKLA